MKKLLLASFLLVSVISQAQAYDSGEEGMMTPKQMEFMRYNGVSVHIIAVRDRLFSQRARAFYDASLMNPYTRPISCSIELISSRGINERYEVIDSKTHLNVYVEPRSSTQVSGNIEIKHGRGDDGLQWLDFKGHTVLARNCMFVD